MKATLKIETTNKTIYAIIEAEEHYKELDVLQSLEILKPFIILDEAKNEGYNQQFKQKIGINTASIVSITVQQIGETKAKKMK